jgi:hypothetical protein
MVTLFLFASPGARGALDPAKTPGQNFDLSRWKLQLPIKTPEDPDGLLSLHIGVDEVKNPALTTYTSKYFYTDPTDGAMRFYAPITGSTTSGSDYPRSELREIYSGTQNSWYVTDGTSILDATVKVLQVPTAKKKTDIGQIHGDTLNTTPLILGYQDGRIWAEVNFSPDVNNRYDIDFAGVGSAPTGLITYRLAMVPGAMIVTINGVTKVGTIDRTAASGWQKTDVYFKAGNYCQSNPTTPGENPNIPVGNGASTAFYSLGITHIPSSLTIATASLPAGNASTPYTQTLQATGASGALTWSLPTALIGNTGGTSTAGGVLPPGLSLSSSGVISGTPTTAAANKTYPNIVVLVTDANGAMAVQTLSLAIGAAKTAATVTLGNLSTTYNGSPRSATATTSPTGLAVNFTYDGGTTAPTNAGSYTVVGTINDAAYTGTATGTLVISKATATVNLGGLSPTYSGTAKTATATTIPSGLGVSFTYDGGASAPTNAGSYPVVATVSDANYTGSASGTLVIGKATATVNLGGLSTAYTGSAQTATATTVPSGLGVSFTYDGSASAPTHAGSYAAVATVSDANYTGSASGTFVIAKATATVSLGGLGATYDGNPKNVTPTTVPSGLVVGVTYDGSSTVPTAVGSYAVAATVSDANYAGSASGTLTIGKATATVTLANLGATYDGSAKSATATPSPSGLGIVLTYDGSTSAPTAAGSYAVIATIGDASYQGSTSGTFVIAKATPAISWSAPSPITSGTALSAAQLNATASVPGIFAYTPAAGTVLGVGASQPLGVTFTPADTANYTGATASTTITVNNKATPTLTWNAPAAIAYGTALSSTQLNATASVPGTFTYTPAAGTILPAGPAQTLSVLFTPTDTAAYNTATAGTTLTVNPITPTVTWTAPPAITYGTALTATQLNASASVPGTFAYTPAAGTVPAAGAGQTLSVTFTPTDSVNYTTATRSTTLTVNQAALTAKADDQTRLYGAANPAFTIAYTGFVNHDTTAALAVAPTASTSAHLNSASGTYAITLTGGSAANYTLTLVNGTLTVTPLNFAGIYFGTFASGGNWALYVRANNTATYIAHLPSRSSAIIRELTLGTDGAFASGGTEIKPAASGLSGQSLASPEAPVLRTAAAAGDYVLAGTIAADGTMMGSLIGLSETFTGAVAAPTGTAQASAGLYTASALGTASGTTYAIVGASGQAVIVTTSPTAVDGATGTVNASGALTTTTSNNAALTLTINPTAQSLSASVTPSGSSTPTTYAGVAATVTPIARVVNLSVRTPAGTGDQTLIVGLVIIGSGNKTLLLRGIGPTLSTQGVTNPLADPTMRLLNSGGVEISANNDWGGSAQMSQNFASVGAFALPANSKDAALYNTLSTGLYSFHTYPNGAGTGVVLAEVYDADDDSSAASVFNISARTQVGTGENILIAGFVITGNTPKTLLIRGLGPTLAAQGVTGALVNPQLYLFGSAGLLASNDDWGGTTALKNSFAVTGAGSLTADNSKDAALLVTLQPGVYSAQVSGVGSTTGVGLVEIFLVP